VSTKDSAWHVLGPPIHRLSKIEPLLSTCGENSGSNVLDNVHAQVRYRECCATAVQPRRAVCVFAPGNVSRYLLLRVRREPASSCSGLGRSRTPVRVYALVTISPLNGNAVLLG
jgi:hypothetical protein